jgi:hypothetical protein
MLGQHAAVVAAVAYWVLSNKISCYRAKTRAKEKSPPRRGLQRFSAVWLLKSQVAVCTLTKISVTHRYLQYVAFAFKSQSKRWNLPSSCVLKDILQQNQSYPGIGQRHPPSIRCSSRSLRVVGITLVKD